MSTLLLILLLISELVNLVDREITLLDSKTYKARNMLLFGPGLDVKADID